MKFLVVVTPPSIYHGCSTRKKFWEETFTGKQDLFQSVNMKNCGCRKVRKHKKIKGSDKGVTVNVSEKFDSQNNMETTTSESNWKLGRSKKGLVTALDLKTKSRSKIYKKVRYAIGNFSMKELSKKSKSLKTLSRYLMLKGSPNMSQLQATII